MPTLKALLLSAAKVLLVILALSGTAEALTHFLK